MCVLGAGTTPQAAVQLASAILWPSEGLAEKEVKMRVKMGTVLPKMGTFVHLRED